MKICTTEIESLGFIIEMNSVAMNLKKCRGF